MLSSICAISFCSPQIEDADVNDEDLMLPSENFIKELAKSAPASVKKTASTPATPLPIAGTSMVLDAANADSGKKKDIGEHVCPYCEKNFEKGDAYQVHFTKLIL